jgi:hypothetical protein
MDVFVSRCNLELCLTDQASLEEANSTFQVFRLALYAGGLSPFLSPFVTTYSINDYSGINERDNPFRREKIDPELAKGLKSDEGTVEAWPVELSFDCILLADHLGLSQNAISDAATKASLWRRLVGEEPLLRVVSDVANSAPKLTSLDQSVLHIWSALEALFPGVSTELSFRIALYLAQLVSPTVGRLACFEKVRDAYSLRSKVAHGSKRNISTKEWQDTWSLLMEAVNAISDRGTVPSEQTLIAELLV